MAKHSHLTLSERIEIEKALRDRASFSEIGASLGKDPSTVSKEVRNHFIIKDSGSRCNPCLYRSTCKHSRDICPACDYKWAKDCAKCSVACYKVCKDFKEEFCPKHRKPPYVCNGCEKRNVCPLRRHLYDAKTAQKEYETTRSESRQGIAVSPEELSEIVKSEGNKQMEDYEVMKNSLISIAGELFRFEGVFARILARMPTDEQIKYSSQYSWFSKKVIKALDTAGLRVINLQGKEYDPGMAATPINLDDFGPDDRLYVEQMVEPIIMEQGNVVKTGTILLGRLEA